MEQVLEILEYVLPILASFIAAKYINQNSKPWNEWSGIVAQILGLFIVILDILRNPKDIAKDIGGYDEEK
jgi:hypothetical protein